MWQDPIVNETRQHRDQYASGMKHDIDAIFRDICERQKRSGVKTVVLKPRKAVVPAKTG